MDKQSERVLRSLTGLSVGDAFGEQFFKEQNKKYLQQKQLPPGIWQWTDDTHMAISIAECLLTRHKIDQGMLAGSFAQRFIEQSWRGYGAGARRLLSLIQIGARWQDEAPVIFPGGSYGNGGAMRAAPIGAYFFEDAEQAVSEAQRSAEVTHAHLEGQVGAMAVAAAAALQSEIHSLSGNELLEQVLSLIPASETADGIQKAMDIPFDEFSKAVTVLGTGQQVAAFDTVPFCLWIVAHHAPDYETAMWKTVAGLGDRDTTCAIVGGITALQYGVPMAWLKHREPLPENILRLAEAHD